MTVGVILQQKASEATHETKGWGWRSRAAGTSPRACSSKFAPKDEGPVENSRKVVLRTDRPYTSVKDEKIQRQSFDDVQFIGWVDESDAWDQDSLYINVIDSISRLTLLPSIYIAKCADSPSTAVNHVKIPGYNRDEPPMEHQAYHRPVEGAKT